MMPNDMHAGIYSATAASDRRRWPRSKSAADGVKLIDAMKAMPTDDPLFGKGSIRVDGRKLHPMCLMTTKTLAESKRDWDYFKLVATITGGRVAAARQRRLPVREGVNPGAGGARGHA